MDHSHHSVLVFQTRINTPQSILINLNFSNHFVFTPLSVIIHEAKPQTPEGHTNQIPKCPISTNSSLSSAPTPQLLLILLCLARIFACSASSLYAGLKTTSKCKRRFTYVLLRSHPSDTQEIRRCHNDLLDTAPRGSHTDWLGFFLPRFKIFEI